MSDVQRWFRNRVGRRASAMAVATAAFALVGVQRAEASTVSVVCNDVPGLITAINNANSNPTSTTITLASQCVYTLTAADNTSSNGPNGLPVINNTSGKTITINGDDATIARSEAGGTPDFRILEVATTGKLSLGDVLIENGRTPDGTGGFPATSAGNGGGIYTAGALTLVGTSVQLNTTGKGGDAGICSFHPGGNGGDGGGIYNTGTTTITHGTVSGNTTGQGGAGDPSGDCTSNGGNGGNGGGVYSSGKLTLTSSTSVSGNLTGFGGVAGKLLTGGNGGNGGGVFQTQVSAGAGPTSVATNLTIMNSTVSGNTTGGGGSPSANSDGFGGNGGNGGGIDNEGTAAKITGGSVTSNTTGRGGDCGGGRTEDQGGFGGNGGGIENAGSTAQLIVGTTAIARNITGGEGSFACGGSTVLSGSDGGGLDNIGGAHATLTKSTVTYNTATPPGDGTGIFSDSGSFLTLTHSTVANNSPPGDDIS